MALAPGTRLGPYEVTALIGEGGMGKVWRAHHTALKRDDALKVLPDPFVNDPERLARFQREAQLLASINHPNIAHVYGLEQADGVHALVMELVEGPTLADRIAQGAIPVDEALPIARQIAEALEAAHEQGIVHRDLKPANVKVRSDGTVKVLDFGLAKAMDPIAGAAPNISLSPTITTPAMTQVGVILGTAAYMSPEQARGRPVDKRSDIWAFGCVLYEMLAGTRAVEGEDVTETLGAVIHKEPRWEALPENTPATVRTVLQRCLQKDLKQRIRDIGDVRLALAGAFESPAAFQIQPLPRIRRRPRIVTIAVSVAAAAAIATIAAWTMLRMTERATQLVRFTIVPPPSLPMTILGQNRDIAISPDGTHIVYRSGTSGQPVLAVRSLDRLDAQPLTVTAGTSGTIGAGGPFLSPDGRWVGFFIVGEMRRVSITGGPPVTICRISGPSQGASWGSDGTIVFATGDARTGLLSVPAAGGEPKVLTKPDTAAGEADHLFPSLLPGGRTVLFTISAGLVENAQVAALDLETGQRKILIRGGSHAEYVESGHLVYVARGMLVAVRFDPARLEVLSDPVAVVEQIMTAPTGAANFAVSRQGALVFVPGGAGTQFAASRSLVWVNRQGREDAIKIPARAYEVPRVSPDGKRVALQISDQLRDIWILDTARLTLERLTLDPRGDFSPSWTPDGQRVLFSSDRAGVNNLYWQAANGTGTAERLTTSLNRQFSGSMSPDGTRVAFTDLNTTFPDISLLSLDKPSAASRTSGTGRPTSLGTGRVEPLIQTPFDERTPEISPDGRWIAYQSAESGQNHIYVRPFPNVESGRWQVSVGGGTGPVWARSGRELFYLDNSNTLTVVSVQTTGSTFRAGAPSMVFGAKYYYGSAGGRQYDISPDGQRFLMIKENGAGEASAAAPTSMVVVLNWVEELKRLVPTK